MMKRMMIILIVASLAIAAAAAKKMNVSRIAFDDGFSHLFGHDNLVRMSDAHTAQLILNRYSGSGFISSDAYHHGFFSASIKLPAHYSAGVVVAFYASNGDVFTKTHDELDFEFLGNTKGKQWRVQTNVYGNGSTSRGREERYLLPFDPTLEPHQYSILWTSDRIIFYIDDVPIREVVRSEAMGGDYPLKPMSVYATIWDGSTWATENGKYKVDYKYAPFVSEFSDLVLRGCRVEATNILSDETKEKLCSEANEELVTAEYASMTRKKKAAMRRFRERYMSYSFCYDTQRYPVAFPDCDIVQTEKSRFSECGENKYMKKERTRGRRTKPASINVVDSQANLAA